MHTSKSQPIQSPGGIDQARGLFAQEGLPFPPVPAVQAPRLRPLAPWVFGTRGLPSNLYDLDWFVQEAAAGQAEDYVLCGHAGHGSNSWAIHFYTVLRPLALFVQIGYGGAYMDRDRSVAKLVTAFANSAELIAAVQAAAQAGKIDPARRLLVVASDLTGGRWAWQSSGETGPKDIAWLRGADVLGEALRAVRQL